MKITVLVVKSMPLTHPDLMRFLTRAGFNIIEAASTSEVWNVLETQPNVRVLLTDLDASSASDGLELARKVHDRWPSVGLVITSNHIRHLRPADVPGDGCFIPRPVPLDTLLQEVRLLT